MQVYWWPPVDVFEESGYWPGYWSEIAERWFQNHLTKIRNDKFKPTTRKNWKSLVKGGRAELQKVSHANESIARQYLLQGAVDTI
ncbi:hypothetical protein BDQ12DRAFT_442491 [Crucibulum laeve]|uniref:Uncharacterized protein n=1 Tax=Crucibulum laeve TaxID=68775 RepID=A0A5C3LX41_9AGAR|nr:hypothetical protein BDQ12DRAFT_442491 [Crucibulum laeve]